MVSFVDPEFQYNKIITKIWVRYTLTLLDSVILPFNVTRYCEELIYFIDSFEASYGVMLKDNGISIGEFQLTAFS